MVADSCTGVNKIAVQKDSLHSKADFFLFFSGRESNDLFNYCKVFASTVFTFCFFPLFSHGAGHWTCRDMRKKHSS